MDNPHPSFPNSSQREKSYDPVYFDALAAIEDKHFWFRARNQVIRALVKQVATSLEPGYRILEIGCGTGNVLRVLDQICKNGLVLGADFFLDGLKFARQRTNSPLVQADLYHLPFKSKFDLICAFDVLEHLQDDRSAIKSLYDGIAPGGVMFLTVPAHQALWSLYDDAIHHCRRYEPDELEEKLSDTGFEILYTTQFMTIIYPFVWLSRKFKYMGLNKKDILQEDLRALAITEFKITPIINPIFSRFLSIEIPFIERNTKMPFGTSLLALARKPSRQPR